MVVVPSVICVQSLFARILALLVYRLIRFSDLLPAFVILVLLCQGLIIVGPALNVQSQTLLLKFCHPLGGLRFTELISYGQPLGVPSPAHLSLRILVTVHYLQSPAVSRSAQRGPSSQFALRHPRVTWTLCPIRLLCPQVVISHPCTRGAPVYLLEAMGL